MKLNMERPIVEFGNVAKDKGFGMNREAAKRRRRDISSSNLDCHARSRWVAPIFFGAGVERSGFQF